MDRRNFFKIVSATSAGVLTTACGNTDKLIPLLVPEHEIFPGVEQWHPAACTECGAGCGAIVRTMTGERTIESKGEKLRQRVAAIKKIEGNPLDPVSGGHLCARGQAAVQGLYHPDRLRGPMKRSGDRGRGEFTPVSWEEAIAAASEQIAKARAADPSRIVILSGSETGTRSLALQRFAEALGAPAPVVCSPGDLPVERRAAEAVFGWKGIPVYDLANAHHVLSVGADFVGGWASPVYYGRQFGEFRQGRKAVRGFLVQAESRLSVTAAAADRWWPLRPGSEPQLLVAVARILLDANLAPNAGALPKPVADAFRSADVALAMKSCGLEVKKVREFAEQLGQSAAPLVLAGASIVHTNSLDALIASHYLNLMLGNIGKPGGVLSPGAPAFSPPENHAAVNAISRASAVIVSGANPAYTLPASTKALDALRGAGTVISFASFLDDTAAMSDLILPDHHALESELVVAPAASTRTVVAIGTPFVEPLYETRPVEKTLGDLAAKMSIAYQAVSAKEVVQPLLPSGLTYEDAARQGGVWLEAKAAAPVKPKGEPLELSEAAFDGDEGQYPFAFQPYLSLQYHDGRGAHLPWLQELPDPASSAVWGLAVEIDPKSAARLQITDGDVVRIESAHGSIETAAYVHPGAIPGVLSMPIGDGHTHYGRYASGRGANPLSILAPVTEKSTGTLVMGGTRVRLSRVGPPRGWVQFATTDIEQRSYGHR